MTDDELHVNHQEFAYIMECTRLNLSEFLTRMYLRWPRLREIAQGEK